MEPMLVPSGAARHGELLDKILVPVQQSTGLHRSLSGHLATSLAGLVRSMDCYYSDLIKGHDTHPVDIERALHQYFSVDPRQRNLQLEARAHVEVQAWIDAGGLRGRAFTLGGCWTSTGSSASGCPRICCGRPGMEIRQKNASGCCPAPCARGMCGWDGTWPSAPAQCRGFCAGLSRYT